MVVLLKRSLKPLVIPTYSGESLKGIYSFQGFFQKLQSLIGLLKIPLYVGITSGPPDEMLTTIYYYPERIPERNIFLSGIHLYRGEHFIWW